MSFFKLTDLKIFLPIALGILMLSGSGFFPAVANAQSTPGPTSASQQPTAEDSKTCGGDSTYLSADGKSCTRKNSDGTTTTCGNSVDGSARAMTSYCSVSYPDASYTIIDSGAGKSTNYTASGSVTGTSVNGILAPTTTGTLKTPPGGADGGCNVILNFNMIGCLADATSPILSIVGYLMTVVGTMFNWVIVITVFQYASYFGNSSGMLVTWGILRDIANIVLLFAFILMGVMMILDLHGINARKALPSLIIFAVLLNFSLFASEAIVDVSNVLTAAIYKQAGQPVLGAPSTSGLTTGSQTQNGFTDVGIAGAIMHATYMDTVLSPSKLPTTATNRLLSYIGSIIFILIVTGVLLAGCILFFTRAVMLSILLVLSPLGFAGMAIPQFQARAQGWLNQLIQNAFFAPTFLLLIFAGLKVMEAARAAVAGSSGASLADALSSPSVNSSEIIIIYALTVGFFVAAFMFAKSSSVAGASFATSFAQNTVQRAVRAPGVAASSTAGFVGRRTVGRASNYLSTKIASSNNFKNTELGRFAKGITDKGASASFDARKIKAVSNILASKPTKGGDHGFHGIEEKAVKERTKYAGTLKNSPDENKAVAEITRQKRDLDEVWNEQKKDLNKNIKDAKTDTEIAAAKSAKATAEKAYNDAKAVFDGQIFDSSAQGKYAANLHKGNAILNATRLAKFPITVQALADHHAIEAIKKGYSKPAIDRALDGIREENAKAAKAGGDAHGGGH